MIAACSVSDEPPTVLVCLTRKSPGNDIFVENGCFALNTLGSAHEALATAFSGVTGLDQAERFRFGDWSVQATGAPVLSDALAVFDCQIVEARDMATHRVLFGRVTGLRIGDSVPPLLYHRRGYRHL